MTENQDQAEHLGNERISKVCGPQKDPLLIDLILDNVFFFCNVKTLKSCRLVDKRWKQLSSSVWTNKIPYLVISKDSDSHVPLPYYGSFEYGKVFNLIDSYAGNNIISNYPSIQKINLWRGNITEDLFWARCGQWIKHLDLDRCTIQSESMLYAILTSKFTPVLETLLWKNLTFLFRLTGSPEISEKASSKNLKMRSIFIKQFFVYYDNSSRCRVKPEFSVSWRYVLSHYPNLKNFRAEIENPERSNFVELLKDAKDLISAMVKLREEDGFEISLDSFELGNFPGFLNSTVLQLLKKANLPFSKFYVEWTKTSSSEELHDLLAMHSKSLKKLKVGKEHWHVSDVLPIYIGPLPRMDILTELLFGIELFQNFNFLRFFPNLESLFLENVYDINEMVEDTYDEDQEGILLKFLRKLRIKQSIQGQDIVYCDALSTQRLVKWMPNVTIVDINFANNAFPLICQGWKNLEHVDLPRRFQPIDDKSLAEISKLTELKTFLMNCDERSMIYGITVKSISQGFSKLQLLKQLNLCMATGFSPKDESLLTLSGNVNAEFYYWDTNGSFNIHEGGGNKHEFFEKYSHSFMKTY